MMRAHCDRARATGMRISRWRPGSLLGAIAGRSWRSTISCARPTTSPTTPTLPAAEKLKLLDRLDAGLTGKDDSDAVAVRLRAELAAHNLSPKHAQDLLAAFKLDVTKLRYRDWDDLIGLLHAVGDAGRPLRLDVHGESRDCWPANDALCAALQIINHLQDCQEDYRNLDRVYVPQDALAACGHDCRSARRAASVAGAADMSAQARRAHRAIAVRKRRLSSPDQRLAPWPRSLGHQHAGASPDAHSDDARSAAAIACICPRPPSPGSPLPASSAARRGGSAGAFPPPRKSRGVRR